MMCDNPISTGQGGTFPCGQCMHCRANRRRLWVHRIMLEAECHAHSAFISLSYNDESLPDGWNLVPKHLQDWLKRIRHAEPQVRLRHYSVGEYGDQSGRPHYHVALFGYQTCLRGQSSFSLRTGRCCPRCDKVSETWGKGIVFLGEVNSHSAQYVAGYVMKKMTGENDERLLGRHPEFARMSLRPGIGALAVPAVAKTLRQFNLDKSQADVPSALRHGKKILPLGRYLRQKLRDELGIEKPEVLDPYAQKEVLRVRSLVENSPDFISSKEAFLQDSKQKRGSARHRLNMWKKKEKF